MSVLVDTSVWVDHFRRSNVELVRLLQADLAWTHPMVLLASTLITPAARLWTLDQRLAALATRFGVAHTPVIH